MNDKKHLSVDEFEREMSTWSFAKYLEWRKKVSNAFKEDYKEGYLDAIDDFLEKLDEARKEFLTLFPMGFDYAVEAPLSAMSKQIMFEHLEMVKEKLLRWFGKDE